MSAAALSVEALSKSYAAQAALTEVSFEVPAGSIAGLLGPNGAGKSTLIRIVMDILQADTGKVSLFGKPRSRDQLDRVAYLPEERGLYRKQGVLETMQYFGELKGLDRAEARRRAERWLERLGLGAVGRKRVEQLSKGMAQKVHLASAFMLEPELFVLDEPFSGLDPISLRQVRALLAEQRARGAAVLLCTHQMNEVQDLADKILLLYQGKLLANASLAVLRAQLGSDGASLEELFVGLVEGRQEGLQA
jgi:ABC-2 type transport system ATP-binding protein